MTEQMSENNHIRGIDFGTPNGVRGMDFGGFVKPVHTQGVETSGAGFRVVGVALVAGAVLFGAIKGGSGAEAESASPVPDSLDVPAQTFESAGEAQYKIVAEANKYLGLAEDPATPNHGPEIDEYFQMGLKGKNAEWCASFVSRVLLDSGLPFTGGSEDGHKGPDWQIEFVNNVYKWATVNNAEIFDQNAIRQGATPAPGDMAVYNVEGRFGDGRSGVNHIGIVTEYDSDTGEVTTIEGNFDNAVSNRTYNVHQMLDADGKKLAGFIRVEALKQLPEAPRFDIEQVASEQLTPEAAGLIDSLDMPAESKDFLRNMLPTVAAVYKSGSRINPEVTLAQTSVETGFGSDGLSKKTNNHFGIKAGKSWEGPVYNTLTDEEYQPGEIEPEQANFRVYASPVESVADYARMIQTAPHFADAATNYQNPEAYLRGLLNQVDVNGNVIVAQGEPGSMSYATDREYASKIMHIINRYNFTQIVAAQVNQ